MRRIIIPGGRPVNITFSRTSPSNNYYLNNNYSFQNERDTGISGRVSIDTINQNAQSICKIITNNGPGSGFFLKFNAGLKTYKCLVTNEHVITKNLVDYNYQITVITEKGNQYGISLNKNSRFIRCFPRPIDITVVEILPNDKIMNDIEFLSCDFNCLNYSSFNQYNGEYVYILQHPHGLPTEIATGKITGIRNGFEFTHSVNTDPGSSGSPVILNSNNKVIGIHKGGDKYVKINYGTFIGKLIEEIQKNNTSLENINTKKNYDITIYV